MMLTGTSHFAYRSIRLTKEIVSYIIGHSGAKLILVDSEYVHLIEGTAVPTVISRDSGREDDPYEQFLGKPNADSVL
jgi:hypothetical protein